MAVRHNTFQKYLLKSQDQVLEPIIFKVTILIVRFIFISLSRPIPPSPPFLSQKVLLMPNSPLLNLACNTTVTVQMSFGGKNWTIDPADFRLSKLSATQCLGAFFELATGSSAPSWIVGDTFLVRIPPFPS